MTKHRDSYDWIHRKVATVLNLNDISALGGFEPQTTRSLNISLTIELPGKSSFYDNCIGLSADEYHSPFLEMILE